MGPSARQRELAAFHLAETGPVALLLNLAQDGRLDGRRGRLAVGPPVAGFEGALDNGLA